MADTLLILTLPSVWSLWLLPISLHSSAAYCWSCSWASQDLMWPYTPRLLMNAPKSSCMTCAMQCVWFLNAGHWIPEILKVDCSSPVIKSCEEVWSVVVPSKWLSVSSKRSRTPFKCTAKLAPVGWHLTYHPKSAFERVKYGSSTWSTASCTACTAQFWSI